MPSKSQHNKSLKITVVGDGSVGKTCMLVTYKTKEFPVNYEPTVFENYLMDVEIEGESYKICLMDTAGQEGYEKLRTLCYCKTDCFLLCYSVNSRISFNNIAEIWHPEVQFHCPNIPVILIGTKQDLRQNQNDCVTKKEVKKLKKKIGAIKSFECSALKNEGLETIFIESFITAVHKPKNNWFTRLFQCK